MNHLQRQLIFIEAMVQREHDRIYKLPKQYPDCMSSTLRGLMSVQRTLDELWQLERMKAIITIPCQGDLPIKEIGKQVEINTSERPFWLQLIDDFKSKKKRRRKKTT